MNNKEEKMGEFWESGVWKVNYKNIDNNKIKQTIKTIQELNNKIINSKIKINIMNMTDISIKNNKNDILEEINNIKMENITYIKTHADCIPEYHKLIFDINLYNKSINE